MTLQFDRPGAPMAAPAPGLPLLSSKLAPPILGHPPLVRRRLLAMLSSGVARTPVTLISGPAGSGKTVLAASWLQERGDRAAAAWLSLDEADDDPATFWAYLAEALTEAGVDLSGLVRPPAGEPVPSSFITVLASRVLGRSRPVVLVLDNSDSLTSAEICRSLDLLVRHAASRLRLVLCARADPLLPLHVYRVGDALTEIRTDALAFTAEETRELLAQLGAPVTPEMAADLQSRTEGWAVGLRLAAAPLKSGMAPADLISSLADQDGGAAQYLFAEVLAHQPAPVRRFLLRVSLTDELWPDLLEKLSPSSNSRRILAALARANAFVEQSSDAPGGYRIHSLFREMLKAQLHFDHPREVASLHQACAEWFASVGRLRVAMGHAIEAGNWPMAARLVVDAMLVGAVLAHEADPCLRCLDAMPPGLPGADAAVIRLALALPRRSAAQPEDLAVVRATAADTDQRLVLRTTAAVVAVCIGARDGAPSEQVAADADAAERLVARLPQDAAKQRRELLASIEISRSFAVLRTDAPDAQLIEAVRAALSASAAAHSSRLRSRLLGQLALLEALRGELCRAGELAAEASEVADDRGAARSDRFPAGAAARAWVAMERYDHAEARHWIARGQEAVPDSELSWVAPLLAVLQSRLLRLRHEFDAAERVLRPHLEASLPRWVRVQVQAEEVRRLLAAGSDEVATGLLDQAEPAPWVVVLRATADVLSGRPAAPLPEDGHLPPALLVETEILHACRELQAGQVTAAVDSLRRALQRAEPEALRRPFFDAPPEIRRLLRGQPQLARSAGWLNPSAGAPPDRRRTDQVAAEPAAEVLQPLSERELEVLRHLAELLSTAEIAAAMFVSVNTVRTHIRSILRKLSVGRRNQAVRRGRELHLL